MGQSSIASHTRKHVARPSVLLSKKNTETTASKSTFRPAEEISLKPAKVHKPTQTTKAAAPKIRRSSRSTSNKYKQTYLSFTSDNTTKDLNTNDASQSQTRPKRKIDSHKATTNPNKKQKTTTTKKNSKEKVVDKVVETKVLEQTAFEETKAVTAAVSEEAHAITEEKADELTKVADQEIHQETKEEVDQVVQNNTNENKDTPEEETHHFEEEIELKSSLSYSTTSACSLVEDDSFTLDTPSPTFHSEPMTPPPHDDNGFSVSAPYKTILSPADKARISDEKAILMKLRKALDIVITDRIAHNQPVLYHKVEPVLRNSTRRAIVIGHLCQIMSVAPDLYDLHAKEIRDFGGKATEAYLIEFDKKWAVPLVGKDLQKRSDILEHGINHYFDTHKEPYATIPKKELPKLDQVVNKKDWISDAKLPPGVKSLITAHERAKTIEAEKAKPKPKPKGSVSDRLAALKARLKERKA